MSSEEPWTAVRYVRDNQLCGDCGVSIPRGSPGAGTGSRGTRAYYQPQRHVWQCLACGTDRTRTELARFECSGCRRLVGRHLVDGVWIHRVGPDQVTACTFSESFAASAPLAGQVPSVADELRRIFPGSSWAPQLEQIPAGGLPVAHHTPAGPKDIPHIPQLELEGVSP
jgi:hypothetical protein